MSIISVQNIFSKQKEYEYKIREETVIKDITVFALIRISSKQSNYDFINHRIGVILGNFRNSAYDRESFNVEVQF